MLSSRVAIFDYPAGVLLSLLLIRQPSYCYDCYPAGVSLAGVLSLLSSRVLSSIRQLSIRQPGYCYHCYQFVSWGIVIDSPAGVMLSLLSIRQPGYYHRFAGGGIVISNIDSPAGVLLSLLSVPQPGIVIIVINSLAGYCD